jgi:hypothetical protein
MSSTPNLTYGKVPTPAQWNDYFAGKQDDLGYTPLNIAGGTMLGYLVAASSVATGAGLNLAPGVAPTAPKDGDMWVTPTGLFVQIGGNTIGPVTAGVSNWKEAAHLATTVALPANTYQNGEEGVGATLVANANGALSVDGVAVAIGDRVLVKNEAVTANNGVYTVASSGNANGPYILARATDYNAAPEAEAGNSVSVIGGNTLSNTFWLQQTNVQTMGTDPIVFAQFSPSYANGNGLLLTGTQFSIDPSVVATLTGEQALTNKTIDGSENTILNVNLEGGVAGTLAVGSGGTGTTTSTGSGSVVLSDSPVLVTPNLGQPSALDATNATGTAAGLIAGTADSLATSAAPVVVSGAAAPTAGQVLTATSATTADWETPSSGLGFTVDPNVGVAVGSVLICESINPTVAEWATLQRLGYSQTWQAATASNRVVNTSYRATSKTIAIAYSLSGAAANTGAVQVSADNTTWLNATVATAAGTISGSMIIPQNWYYRYTSGTIVTWIELW